MSFENIIGNESVKKLLIHSAYVSNLLHSYMFIGLDGIGKSLFAKEFAKLILKADDLINYPDFMMLESEDGKSIKINQVRYLQEKIAEKPIVSNKKIYIINNADLMTVEAQNCLLKTLEEPPEYVIIILIVSNENKLLTTIKSRCTKIQFKPLSEQQILQYFSLNNLELPSKTAITASDGSIGKILQIVSDISQYEKLDVFLNNLIKMDMIDLWNSCDILYNSKDNINNLLEYINIFLLEKLKETKNIHYARLCKGC